MQNLARHRATLPSLQTNGHNRGTCRFESVPTTVMTSGFRRLIARMLLAVFVFAQLATAAHACVSLGLNAAGDDMSDFMREDEALFVGFKQLQRARADHNERIAESHGTRIGDGCLRDVELRFSL